MPKKKIKKKKMTLNELLDSIKYFPYRLWNGIKDVYYGIKYFLQAVFRGYPDPDVWGLDDAIARFTVPRLKALMKCLHGYPGDLTEKKWDEILKKILWSLEWVLDCYGENDKKIWKHVKKTKVEIEKDEKRLADKHKWFYNPDFKVIFNKKRYEAMNKRYKEGMELFAKYFSSLCD